MSGITTGSIQVGSGGWFADSSATTATTYTYTFPSNIEISTEVSRTAKGEISASLYIKYVKSKLGKIQTERVKRRLQKLQKLVAYSKEMKQRALYEELTNEVAVLVREAQAVAFKIDRFLDIKDIEKFRNRVKDKVIQWNPIEKFPRVVPAAVTKRLKQLQKAQVFDEYWILYIDYTGKELKTNKEKIKQKDPILFGRFNHQKDRYYYIADWVDEYCDLTLDKFIDAIKEDDPEFALSEVPDIDKARWDGIVSEVKGRVERLEKTNRENYQELMKEEDERPEKKKWTWRSLRDSFWRKKQ